MRERIEKLVGAELGRMWVGTFHSLFARIMRRFGDRMGYNRNFAIYDREDQERMMKAVLADFPDYNASRDYRRMVRRISSIKLKAVGPLFSTKVILAAFRT